MKGTAFDVILLDLHLRQGNGFGVLRAMAKSARRPAVIVLTNYDLEEYRAAALAMGATYFLDKARDMDRLPEMIDTIRSEAPATSPRYAPNTVGSCTAIVPCASGQATTAGS